MGRNFTYFWIHPKSCDLGLRSGLTVCLQILKTKFKYGDVEGKKVRGVDVQRDTIVADTHSFFTLT